MQRLAISLAALLVGAWIPDLAEASDGDDRPFGRGTVVPRIGFGVGFAPDLVAISWRAGAGYFVVNGLEIGATFGGTHLIWDEQLREQYPGLTSKIPDHFFELTPLVRYVFFRNRWFSPYAFAGVGPTFLTDSPGDPVLAHWTAGPGFAIGLGRHVFLDISVTFAGRFPRSRCEEAFTDVFETDQGLVELSLTGMCGFRWSPGIGVGFMF